jgi:uncharacterized protein with GYD domain
MATYVSLVSWTDQGIRNFKDTMARATAAKDLATRMGGEMKELYWTLGPYDIVIVAEFPDDETGTAYLLAIGALGSVRTTTMRAFGQDQIQAIVAKAAAE